MLPDAVPSSTDWWVRLPDLSSATTSSPLRHFALCYVFAGDAPGASAAATIAAGGGSAGGSSAGVLEVTPKPAVRSLSPVPAVALLSGERATLTVEGV